METAPSWPNAGHLGAGSFGRRVCSAAKTVADCFRYRNKLGLDVALEAFRLYRECSSFAVEDILYYAGVCRVETVIRPYLEALL